MKRSGWLGESLVVLGVACSTGARAAEWSIQSLDGNGRMTFQRLPTAEVYRVEHASAPTGAWTRLTDAVVVDGIPTTLDCIPGRASGIVTCTVPTGAGHAFFRTVANLGGMAPSTTKTRN